MSSAKRARDGDGDVQTQASSSSQQSPGNTNTLRRGSSRPLPETGRSDSPGAASNNPNRRGVNPPPRSSPSAPVNTNPGSSGTGSKDTVHDSTDEQILKQIPSEKEALHSQTLKSIEAVKGALLVRLKPDGGRINQSTRNKHMIDIQKASRPHMPEYTGIEMKIAQFFPGYIGYFHGDVEKLIRGSTDIVENVEQNIEGQLRSGRTTPNWAIARILEKDESFKKLQAQAPEIWPYNTEAVKGLGEGVNIHILDNGSFHSGDFEGEYNRVTDFEGTPLNLPKRSSIGDKGGHATVVANMAGGKSRGMAPKAHISIFDVGMGVGHKVAVIPMFLGLSALSWSMDKFPGYNILNMSWGMHLDDRGHSLAVALKGLMEASDKFLPVAAAENEDRLLNEGCDDFPANVRGVLVVSNSDENNQKYPDCAWGPKVDVYAPGVKIAVQDYPNDIRSGTSYSTPLVSGFIANLLSTEADKKNFTRDQVFDCIRKTYSRVTQTLEINNQKYDIRTITPYAQGEVQPVQAPTKAIPVLSSNSILVISMVKDGFDIIFPVDAKPYRGNAAQVDDLLRTLESKDDAKYAAFMKDQFGSTMGVKSYNELTDIRVEYAESDKGALANLLAKCAKLAKGLRPRQSNTFHYFRNENI